MNTHRIIRLAAGIVLLCSSPLQAGVGDPQVRTEHVWYPGELACSTFDRLFETQADLYEYVVGERPTTDEQRAIAAWLWRNTHYWHGEEGAENLWGQGFQKGGDLRTREYWTGLFAHGFGLCGTTHSQWTVELQQLFGHGRARGVGVAGHNALEVFLKGGAYGDGRWALVDHDLSCLVFDAEGKRLCSIAEIGADLKRLTDRNYKPQRQRGWLISGLHPGDAAAYAEFNVAESLPGYAGPPPMVHLRRGERLRRYPKAGLEDGKTFIFWGRNYREGGVPGPARSLTWVNQPETMYKSKSGPKQRAGQARFANAVFIYEPNFKDGSYREGIVNETPGSSPLDPRASEQVTFSFSSPYIIAATPASDADWGIYEPGCKHGLIVRGQVNAKLEVSIDQGAHWIAGGGLAGGVTFTDVDLTDIVKGSRQYWLRIGASPEALRQAGLVIVTACQANSSTMPLLTDNGAKVTFAASGQAVQSIGPTRALLDRHLTEGAVGSPSLTLRIDSPHGEPIRRIYAAAHVASGNPPQTDVVYKIEATEAGYDMWQPVVADWKVPQLGEQPSDFWSQSFVWGNGAGSEKGRTPVDVRFTNTGKRPNLRAEAHVVYSLPKQDATKTTFRWTDDQGEHTESHTFTASTEQQTAEFATGADVRTKWVEFEAIAAP